MTHKKVFEDYTQCHDCRAVWRASQCPELEDAPDELEQAEKDEYEVVGSCPDCGGYVAYVDASDYEDWENDQYFIGESGNPGSPLLS